MVKTLNVGIQMKECKNAIYFIFLQAAANRLQIYKTLFIYFCLVYKDAVKLKKPLFGIQRRRHIKKTSRGK